MRSVPSGTYSYDSAGNLAGRVVASGTWSYGYDALERLVSVRLNGTLIVRYGYDVAGRRIVKRVYSGASGGTVGYLRMSYTGDQVAFETDSAATGAPAVIYTWGPGVDQLAGVRVGGTDYGLITDPLGSVRALVRRSDGSWAGRLTYDPYGQLLDSAGPQPALRYRWTGREWDAETGFYFHRTRYYDPAVGRFVQEDRVGYAGGGNLYAYVTGDVLQARDPQGLVPTEDKYRLPESCCGIWNSPWDGWFGIIGTLLPVKVWQADVEIDGRVVRLLFPRTSELPSEIRIVGLDPQIMLQAISDCLRMSATCAKAIGILVNSGVKVDLGFESPEVVAALNPKSPVQGGAWFPTRVSLLNGDLQLATIYLDRTWISNRYGEYGLVLTHEFGHVYDYITEPWYRREDDGAKLEAFTHRWDSGYCAEHPSRCVVR